MGHELNLILASNRYLNGPDFVQRRGSRAVEI